MRFLRENAQAIVVVNILLSLVLCVAMLYFDSVNKSAEQPAPAYASQENAAADDVTAPPIPLPTPAPRQAPAPPAEASLDPHTDDGQPAKSD